MNQTPFVLLSFWVEPCQFLQKPCVPFSPSLLFHPGLAFKVISKCWCSDPVIWLLLQSPYLLFGLRVMGCGRKAWSFTFMHQLFKQSGLVLYYYKLMDFSLSILCFNPFPSLLCRDSSIFAGAIGFGVFDTVQAVLLVFGGVHALWCDTQHLVTGWCLFSASALCLERLCERVTPVFVLFVGSCFMKLVFW